MSTPTTDLVSVVIPCYNQSLFLTEAIESVLGQTYSPCEIIVVNDGSSDDTAQVAGRYPQVCCITQENQGLSAARNTGLANSHGSFLVFLDADDRLLAGALESGVTCLKARPQCAFVYGHLKVIAEDGSPLPTPSQHCVDREHCLELLRRDYIWTPGVVMYRRTVFESIVGFDTLIDACADCDLNIRITRDWPVYCHGQVILEYRKHAANMSRNPGLMLKTSIAAHRKQLKYVKGNRRYEEAAKLGKKAAQDYFGSRLIKEVERLRALRKLKLAMQGTFMLLRYHPKGLAIYILQEMHRRAARSKYRRTLVQLLRLGARRVGFFNSFAVTW